MWEKGVSESKRGVYVGVMINKHIESFCVLKGNSPICKKIMSLEMSLEKYNPSVRNNRTVRQVSS